jgi:soluble lytic murein transglycosylase-like protein
MVRLPLYFVFVLAFSLLSAKAATCYEHASARYGVPANLLKAIALQESSGRAQAFNRNPNGTFDMGLMQINSAWLPTLARQGIQPQHLWDPCVSTLVGAWILANNFARLGYNTQGLGAYNAASPHKRERYARQVLRRLTQVSAYPQQTAWVTHAH